MRERARARNSGKCRLRQYRVMGLLCLKVTREGLSEVGRSLNEEKSNKCQEEKHSSYRKSKYKGFEESLAYSRNTEKKYGVNDP